MKTKIAALLAFLSAAVLLRADEEKPSSDAAKGVDAIIQSHQKEETAWMNKMRAAKREEQQELMKQRPDPAKAVEALQKEIEKDPASESALKAIDFIAMRTMQIPDSVLELAAKHHLDKDGLANLVMRVAMNPAAKSPAAKAFLKAVEESKNKTLQGAAAYAAVAAQQGDEEKFAAAAEKFLAKFPDFTLNGRKISKMLEGKVKSAMLLGIGKEAPEIEGEDVDGKKMKLTDYRGKVVVLDFWGYW
jgi:tetratricopeptide (TPR) repeat protein